MFSIIELKPEDYNSLQKLWMSVPGFKLSEVDDSEENITKFIEMNKGLNFAVIKNSIIVGSILVGFDGRVATIYNFCVAPEYRNEGMGHALLNKALNSLKEKNVCVVNMESADQSVCSFLYKFGFKITDTVSCKMSLRFQNYTLVKKDIK